MAQHSIITSKEKLKEITFFVEGFLKSKEHIIRFMKPFERYQYLGRFVKRLTAAYIMDKGASEVFSISDGGETIEVQLDQRNKVIAAYKVE